uniref:Inner centromere protein-related protein SLI15 n=1 Tax=Anthurium amnicola TaxID=1678845 RepID=A0A1D1YQP9_9ARAE
MLIQKPIDRDAKLSKPSRLAFHLQKKKKTQPTSPTHHLGSEGGRVSPSLAPLTRSTPTTKLQNLGQPLEDTAPTLDQNPKGNKTTLKASFLVAFKIPNPHGNMR